MSKDLANSLACPVKRDYVTQGAVSLLPCHHILSLDAAKRWLGDIDPITKKCSKSRLCSVCKKIITGYVQDEKLESLAQEILIPRQKIDQVKTIFSTWSEWHRMPPYPGKKSKLKLQKETNSSSSVQLSFTSESKSAFISGFVLTKNEDHSLHLSIQFVKSDTPFWQSFGISTSISTQMSGIFQIDNLRTIKALMSVLYRENTFDDPDLLKAFKLMKDTKKNQSSTTELVALAKPPSNYIVSKKVIEQLLCSITFIPIAEVSRYFPCGHWASRKASSKQYSSHKPCHKCGIVVTKRYTDKKMQALLELVLKPFSQKERIDFTLNNWLNSKGNPFLGKPGVFSIDLTAPNPNVLYFKNESAGSFIQSFRLIENEENKLTLAIQFTILNQVAKEFWKSYGVEVDQLQFLSGVVTTEEMSKLRTLFAMLYFNNHIEEKSLRQAYEMICRCT